MYDYYFLRMYTSIYQSWDGLKFSPIKSTGTCDLTMLEYVLREQSSPGSPRARATTNHTTTLSILPACRLLGAVVFFGGIGHRRRFSWQSNSAQDRLGRYPSLKNNRLVPSCIGDSNVQLTVAVMLWDHQQTVYWCTRRCFSRVRSLISLGQSSHPNCLVAIPTDIFKLLEEVTEQLKAANREAEPLRLRLNEKRNDDDEMKDAPGPHVYDHSECKGELASKGIECFLFSSFNYDPLISASSYISLLLIRFFRRYIWAWARYAWIVTLIKGVFVIKMTIMSWVIYSKGVNFHFHLEVRRIHWHHE